MKFKTLALSMSAFLLHACSTTTLSGVEELDVQAHQASDILSINWYHGGDKFQPVIDAFTDKTGIPVEVTSDYDGFNTDVIMIGDYKTLTEAKLINRFDRFDDDFFEEMSEHVPAKWRDEDQRWLGFAVRFRTALVNKQAVSKSEYPTSLLDLADPKWRGRLTVRAARNVYNRSALAYIISRYGEDTAKQWAEGIVANLGDGEYLNDVEQAFAVAEGEYDIGYANTYYLGYMPTEDWYGTDPEDLEKLKTVEERLDVVWLNDGYGNFANVTGVAIAGPVKKGSQKHTQAQELIRFLLSKEGQELMTNNVHKYPVRADVPPSVFLQNMGDELVVDDYDVNDLRFHYGDADRIMNEAGWQTEW